MVAGPKCEAKVPRVYIRCNNFLATRNRKATEAFEWSGSPSRRSAGVAAAGSASKRRRGSEGKTSSKSKSKKVRIAPAAKAEVKKALSSVALNQPGRVKLKQGNVVMRATMLSWGPDGLLGRGYGSTSRTL